MYSALYYIRRDCGGVQKMKQYKGTELIQMLCGIYGPTGFEAPVADFIRTQIEPFCDAILPDRVGNLIGVRKGGGEGYNATAPKKVMVSAHMDEVGFIVRNIDENGYVSFLLDGGIDSKVLAGRSVVLFNETHTVKGVINAKAIHSLSPEERKEALPPDKLYIDIGAVDAADAKAYIGVGDYGTFDSDFVLFGENNRMMKSKALDDRFGCAAMIEVLHTLYTSGQQLPFDLYFAFTVREEIGNSGAQCAAQKLAPDYAIVLETTAVADIAGVPENARVSDVGQGGVISLMDRSTVYDRSFADFAMETARRHEIKAQIKRYVSGGNDAGHIHKSGVGVSCLAISAPTRYLHSACCVASVEDYEAIRALLQAVLIDGGAKEGLFCR